MVKSEKDEVEKCYENTENREEMMACVSKIEGEKLFIRKMMPRHGGGYQIRKEGSDGRETYVNAKEGINVSQVEAIKKGREIAKEKNIDNVILQYEPHNSIWSLEEYLDKHPKIKEDVKNEEEGFF